MDSDESDQREEQNLAGQDSGALDPEDAWCDTQSHFDRYRRYGVHPRTLKSVVNRLMAKKGYGQNQTSHQVQQAWQEVVSPELAPFTRVAEVRRGILEIYVSNSMVLQQMGFLQHNLLKQLQSRLPAAQLKGLRFKLGSHGTHRR